ncbi:Brix-domain-containing protein [Suillus occidentalis]|nr:Brix-domain-containing protein [Suillus occidentalis]
MLRTVKPRNARSKRALEAREAKEVEDVRTAIFVKGTHTGEIVNGVMKELMALKRPDAISFSKKNAIHPFEDASSLEFWAGKNDASMFLMGQSTKKRPAGLVLARMFDARVLDMCEFGVDRFVSMGEFKTPKSTPGHKPMIHFASELFDTHPRFIQVKSLLMDFFNGEVIEEICLSGLEHVISVSLAPSPAPSQPLPPILSTSLEEEENVANLPKIHIRTYTVSLLPSGTRIPRVELREMGPFLDLSLRRHQPPDPEMWKAALRRPKLKKQDLEKGLGKKKKNMEVDEMGDLRGRVHIAKQDLGKLQTRKMKGLKSLGRENDHGEDGDHDHGEDSEGEEPRLKRRKRD